MSNNYLEIADAHQDGVRKETFDTLGQRLNQDSADLKSLQDQVNSIASESESDINQLNNKINQANSDIDGIEGNITTINTNIKNLQDTKINKPTSTTVNKLPKFSSTSGDLGQSGVTVDDNNNVTANTLISSVPKGTAPLQVTSDTKVANFNADKLDGYEATDFLRIAQLVSSGTASGYFKLPVADKTIIVQWGSGTTGASTAYGTTGMYMANTPNLTFPIEFPNAVFYIGAQNAITSAAWVSAITNTLKTCMVYLTSLVPDQPASDKVTYFAIGY